MEGIERFRRGTPEAQFFSEELGGFIDRAMAAGLDAGRSASCAICIAGYIAAAYFPSMHLEGSIDRLAEVFRRKALQAVEEAREDRDHGRLPPWSV